MGFISRIVMALGLKSRVKSLFADLIDSAVSEGKAEVDKSKKLKPTEKEHAKLGVDLVAERLKARVEKI